MTLPEIETTLSIEADFDADGNPRVEVIARLRQQGAFIPDRPLSAALRQLESDGVPDATLAKIASDAGKLRMAVVDELLQRREITR